MSTPPRILPLKVKSQLSTKPLVLYVLTGQKGSLGISESLRHHFDLILIESVTEARRLSNHVRPALILLEVLDMPLQPCPLAELRSSPSPQADRDDSTAAPPVVVVLPTTMNVSEPAFLFREANALIRGPVGLDEHISMCEQLIQHAKQPVSESHSPNQPKAERLELEEKLISSQIAYETTDKLLKSATQRLADAYQSHNKVVHERDALEREIQVASRQLIQADRLATIGSLVAGVAHDITNPTNLISMNKELLFSNIEELETVVFELLGDPVNDEVKVLIEMFEKVFASSKVALQDITLGVDRIYAINQAIRKQSRRDDEKTEFLVSELIRECITIVRSRSKSAEITLDGDHTITFTGYRSHLGQVIMNLLSNGIDAAEQSQYSLHGQALVNIGFQSDASTLHIWVEDNGPGIPDDLRDKIFAPFFTTKPSGKGTGLGMPIIAKIVEEHDGRIDLRPFAQQTGARFDMYLPLNEESLI